MTAESGIYQSAFKETRELTGRLSLLMGVNGVVELSEFTTTIIQRLDMCNYRVRLVLHENSSEIYHQTQRYSETCQQVGA